MFSGEYIKEKSQQKKELAKYWHYENTRCERKFISGKTTYILKTIKLNCL